MDRYLRNWRFWSAVAILVTAVVLMLIPRSEEASRAPMPSDRPADAPEAAMEGMRATEFRQGRKRWGLVAERAEFDREAGRTLLRGVTLQVSSRPPFGEMVVKASMAEYGNASKDLLLPQGVTGSGDRRLAFTAGEAVFRNESGLLTARGPVRYRDELLQVEGEEMEFDTERRDLRLRGNVRATIRPGTVER